MVSIRLEQVEQGDRNGFFGELYTLLRSVDTYHNPDDLWTPARHLSKGQWKSRVDSFVEHLNDSLFAHWLEVDGPQQKWLRPIALDDDVEDYTRLPLNLRTLLASARLSVTRAGADIPGSPSALCRCCRLGVPETIQHLTLDCPTFDAERRQLWCPAVIPNSYAAELWASTLRLSADKLASFFCALNSHFCTHLPHPLFFEPKHVFPSDFFNISPDEQRCDVHTNISSYVNNLCSFGEID